MFVFLYKGGFETGEELAVALKDKIKHFRPTRNLARVIRRRGVKPTDFLLRWGTTKNAELDSVFSRAGAKILNSASAIEANTNKLNSLVVFKSAGVPVPVFYKNKKDIRNFPVLGRKFNHKGGKDIIMISGSIDPLKNDYSKIPDRHFYTEFIPSEAEYRVHVFAGKVIRITKKVFRGHDRFDKDISEKCVIRNDTYGWGHHALTDDELKLFSKDALDVCVRAVKAIGLDFGAVDLLIGKGRPYVLEVNSCPRLNSIGMELYANSIKAILPRMYL